MKAKAKLSLWYGAMQVYKGAISMEDNSLQ